eukprot:m.22959 g.22959  ORF g.22959 m.22959 type:complete len:825 (+) comp8437_c0_seq3:139-2613(+)
MTHTLTLTVGLLVNLCVAFGCGGKVMALSIAAPRLLVVIAVVMAFTVSQGLAGLVDVTNPVAWDCSCEGCNSEVCAEDRSGFVQFIGDEIKGCRATPTGTRTLAYNTAISVTTGATNLKQRVLELTFSIDAPALFTIHLAAALPSTFAQASNVPAVGHALINETSGSGVSVTAHVTTPIDVSQAYLVIVFPDTACGVIVTDITHKALDNCPALERDNAQFPESLPGTGTVTGSCTNSLSPPPTATCAFNGTWTFVQPNCNKATTTPPQPTSGPDSTTKNGGTGASTGPIVGGAVGGVLVIVLVVVVILVVLPRMRSKQVARSMFGDHQLNEVGVNLHYDNMMTDEPGDMYQDPSIYGHADDIVAVLQQKANCVPSKTVTLVKRIGAGEFGEVFHAQITKGGKAVDCAVKTLLPGSKPEDKLEFLKEAVIMVQFRHPNVLGLLGVVIDQEPNMILTELMTNGSLLGYLKRSDVSLTLEGHLQLGLEVARGMQYLTGKGFVHRDLAARNVLVAHDKTARVADFGLSKEVDDQDYFVSEGGKIPIKWTAPEAIHDRKYTASSDVWAFAILMWEILTNGQKPYPGMNNIQVVRQVDQGYRMCAPDGCPQVVHTLMLQCWHENRRERPTFSELVTSLQQLVDQARNQQPLSLGPVAPQRTSRRGGAPPKLEDPDSRAYVVPGQAPTDDYDMPSDAQTIATTSKTAPPLQAPPRRPGRGATPQTQPAAEAPTGTIYDNSGSFAAMDAAAQVPMSQPRQRGSTINFAPTDYDEPDDAIQSQSVAPHGYVVTVGDDYSDPQDSVTYVSKVCKLCMHLMSPVLIPPRKESFCP